MAINAGALTYEEAFSSIKSMPQMKGVDGTLVSGDNDFSSIGVTDGKIILWNNESGQGNETGVYGDSIYRIMAALPVSEIVQCRIGDGNLMAIFARPQSGGTNRILILSDSAGAGFTGAIIGNISNENLNALRKAILLPRDGGGTAIYLDAINF